MIKKFIVKNKNSYFFKSLGQKLFFSVVKISDIFIGNSSSGILEVPFLEIPVLNIGNRQKGRFQFIKVFESIPQKKAIINHIDNILKEKIKKNKLKLKFKKNASSLIAKNIIKNLKNKKYIYLKNKIFYDLNF